MAIHISNDKIGKHSVDKYNFKVLSSTLDDTSQESQTSSLTQKYTSENNPNRRESDIDSSAMSQSSKDALIESLMQKTDEMSSNFIKLQMKLEEKEEDYLKEIQKVKEDAFNEGFEAGIKKATSDKEASVTNGLAQFSSSVKTLEDSAKKFDIALENIKGELIAAALDISKEVINAELSQNSSEIAKVLGDELIKELQHGSKITLRVNPKDHGVISEHVGSLEHVEVVSDGAVSEGGVVAISDVGNIDSQISKRFEKVKRAALSE
jgi:flagellar assembly protein FliH